jgi:hypothetical protein
MSRMRSALPVVAVILCGFLGAATLGYAAYIVSRDSVGVPVTKLDTPPQNLAPSQNTSARPKPKPKTVATPPPPPATTTVETGDDNGGRSSGSGKGSDDSGHGGNDD